jgi:sugar (pentulose or hexulose) kinase
VVEAPGDVTRCALESLTLKYRWVLDKAKEVSGRCAENIHVLGREARNTLLCQLLADATRRAVLAGPVEATALGNLMIQVFARGHVSCLQEIREVVRRLVEIRTLSPAMTRMTLGKPREVLKDRRERSVVGEPGARLMVCTAGRERGRCWGVVSAGGTR